MVSVTATTRRGTPVARVISGILHASVLGLLALPFITFQASCGPSQDVTGYKALVGFTLTPATVEITTTRGLPVYGPNVAIGLLLVIVVAGVGAAYFGRPRGALVGLGTALVGMIAVVAAVGEYPTFNYQGYPVYSSWSGGAVLILAVMVLALVTNAVSILRMRSHPARGGPPVLRR